MVQASLYILTRTARNRLRLRLQRLREPRYLLGAIAGAAYVYFTIFARMRGRAVATRRRAGGPVAAAACAAVAASGPPLAGFVLMVAAAAAWALPFDSGLLDFTDPEIQFLFPAPVSRRALAMHRLLRSQIGLLFGAVVMGLLAPSGSGGQRLRLAIGMWVLTTIARVYFAIVTLTRLGPASDSPRSRRSGRLSMAIALVPVGVVGVAVARAVAGRPLQSIGDASGRLTEALSTGMPRVVAWPFVAAARPLFAQAWGPFAEALAWAVLVLGVVVGWMLHSDERVQVIATVAERRAGEKGARTASYRPPTVPGLRAPTGRPEVAFAWKAAAQTLRVVDGRTFLRIGILLAALSLAAVSLGGGSSGVAATMSGFWVVVTLFTILMAPQTLRVDLRQDLRHLDLLKTWPVRASAIVRGEILWPGLLLTGIAWASTAMACLLAVATPVAGVAPAWVAIAVAVLTPALIVAQLTIHNAVAVAFPAWVPLGHQRPRGLDAMGQRLIILGGTWLLLAIAALPGGAAGAIVWVTLHGLVGSASLVPAALVCSTALVMEVLVATEMLGPAYERLDLLAVDRGED